MIHNIPAKIGTIHFIGIGGIGMSGIAEILYNLGYQVQGSDSADNANVKRLQALGIKIYIGHNKKNIENARIVVVSSAISPNNIERIAAKEKNLAILKRSEMLAELMRLKWAIAVAGTHGKTTTTSIIASLFDATGEKPSVINGGIINSFNTNAYLGNSPWMVVEADESDGSLSQLEAMIAVVTNIDPEHLDFYKNFESLKKTFLTFIHNIPFYGFAVMCTDHPVVKSLKDEVVNRRVLSYGFEKEAMTRGLNYRPSSEGSLFDATIKDTSQNKTITFKDMYIPIVGKHNVLNTLAAIAIAYELGFSESVIREGLEKFSGVKRRFTQVASIHNVRIIDDYGHHPVEIKAVLEAARSSTKGKVFAIMQPHRYSRLHSLFDEFCHCFDHADIVCITDVYSAGEKEIPDVNSVNLSKKIAKNAKKTVLHIESEDNLFTKTLPLLEKDDCVIFLGAGDITKWAHRYAKKLNNIKTLPRQDKTSLKESSG